MSHHDDVHVPPVISVSPIHHAIDALTAAMLDLQRLGRQLENGGEIRREHLDGVAKVDQQLHEMTSILLALRLESDAVTTP